jgi:uroporphyrinogen decarboxylase
MTFEPDYRAVEEVMRNRKPARLPLYEHTINPPFMEQVLGIQFSHLLQGDRSDVEAYFKHYCGFYRKMTYDTVSFEVTVTDQLPGHGAILGGRPGPIRNRQDFERYPWDDLPDLYWQAAEKQFLAIDQMMPAGMKAIGGVGNGIFEISEDLVGMEYLAYLQADDAPLHAELYRKIGDLMYGLWDTFLRRFGDGFAACRMGDDLGYKSGLLTSPETIRKLIMPQYKRIIGLIHAYGKPFLWHSCGCIFDIMDEMIDLGIDAKHSNEDQIAPFDQWIDLYGGRIGLLGGIDVNLLCQEKPAEVRRIVLENGLRFRKRACGYALGSGNSIPEYVPVDGYLAMVEAVQILREEETA